MKKTLSSAKLSSRVSTAWQQAKGSPFLLPVTIVKGDDPAAIAIHRTSARLFVPSRMAAFLQLLAFPMKWVRANVSSARHMPAISGGRYHWLRHLPKGLWETAVHNFEPASWYKYGIWRFGSDTNIAKYITHREICILLPHLNRNTETGFLAQKIPFWRFCRNHNIPCAPILAVATRGKVDLSDSSGSLPPTDLFLKLEDMYCGIGAELWQWSAEKEAWYHNGVWKNKSEFLRHLQFTSQENTLLVQPRLMNHPDILPFTNGSLATLRVVTCRVPGEEPKVLARCLRMPTGASEVDNFAAGGLAAGVSEHGIVNCGVAKSNPLKLLQFHPDSGYRFEGAQLPMFEEAEQLCLKAHGLFQKPCFVGWDVAFLENGPILLEANTTWCVDLLQMAYQKPAGDFGFIDAYISCLREEGSGAG